MGRNWDYSKRKGREMRLEAELSALHGGEPVPEKPPLFSHDATMQHYFEIAWQRVTQCDIELHCGKAAPIPLQGDKLAKLRSIKQCHFQ